MPLPSEPLGHRSVDEQWRRIRDVLHTIPEVKTVVYKAGRPEDGTDPKLISMAEILVDLKPGVEWKRKISKEDLIDEMEARSRKIPGIQASFSQPIRDNMLESISQIDGQIVIKVFGEDLVVLRDDRAAHTRRHLRCAGRRARHDRPAGRIAADADRNRSRAAPLATG